MEFIAKVPITKGWSGDQKFCVTAEDGQKYLLRVSDITAYERKKAEFDMMARVHALGVVTPKPCEFGLCDDGQSVYSLTGWLEGEDAASALPRINEAEQYALGLQAGQTLRKIHAIPAPDGTKDWAARFDKKVQYWLDDYNAKPEVHSENSEMAIRYLRENREVLAHRRQTFIHGDYNAENIMVMPEGKIGVIDFSSFNSAYGDPWWDFNMVAWMETMYPHFYTGQVRGYFEGDPPMEFWHVFAYYLAYDVLAALTDPYGLNGLEDGTEIARNILSWIDYFRNPVPTWYLK